ncbi:superfamily ii helicase [Salinarchaeum sp. Harcht-Bsk1]|uniref:DEAD/DEAH box helicase n=1 Tax=Salinarchaeum sp. Harcht-Bsk1 TaxID=1333523 RepID=UPI00034240C3|nr:DEAD/DEAH box helicase [Salinarchaeum sp. Harcht-Bsk1]AGN01930.1 superfamily ii helicase [Salinarchaeum sp. Harcht-Bsk1]
MHVADLPLAADHVAHFEGQGIEELYPPQAAAVEAGICDGESVVAAVPTASGKTMIAQLAALTADGPAVYVVPLRALATEKAETFDAIPGLSVGVATGDFDATDEELAGHDVVVATAEKVDAAIRHEAAWVDRIACAVLDEVHVLDQEGRGPTLEVTIAKLRRLNPAVQLVALSATVPNADEIADWLDAAVVRSEWRPVELRTGIYADETLVLGDGVETQERPIEPGDLSATGAIVQDALNAGGQCLVFVSSRREARQLASTLAGALEIGNGATDPGADGSVADGGTAIDADREPEEQASDETTTAAVLRDSATTVTGEALADVAESGIAFHHAGLTAEHRSLVEAGFRDGDLRVLCATPTLAAGVNVPARRVIVRDHERYGESGYEPLSPLEVRQMFGRAGRPGLDPYGEAILVAEDASERDELRERYLEAEPAPVTSKLDDPESLRPHVLASVAGGVADSRAQLADLLAETFCAHCGGGPSLQATAADAIDRLIDAGMLVDDGAGDADEERLEATELGALVSRVYVDPATGATVVEALERADDLERITPLTVCEIVCDTAEMPTRYVGQAEAGRLSEVAMRHADELARPIGDFEGDFHAWLSVLKTARLLADYADGVPLDQLVDGYNVGPGDVRRYAERAEWLLAATESLAEHVDSDATERIRDTRERLAERTG